MYDDFIKLLESKLGKDLPGDLSHQKMMSYSRPTAAEAFNHKIPPRKSGVLLLLYPKGDEMHTVFIKRPSYKGVHSAQISFPGGRHEPEDSDLEETALREAEEEVGVKRNDVRIIGQLSELYIPPSNFLVYPSVGLIDYEPQFVPQEREVDQIIESSLQTIIREETIEEREIFIKNYNRHITAPTFQVEGHTIWGATAMILAEFKDLIVD
jgi:8-oxo-dGTP pyrophosphatase MutT (NUDIX family)